MTKNATPQAIIDHCREQSGFCRFLGSPFMAELCEAMAHDIEAGGPVAELTRDWAGDPKRDALSLRIAGYLHHSVLTVEAADLSAVYPGTDKDWTMQRIWPLAALWLAQTVTAAKAFMISPPQTNEVRRSIALLPGFLQLAARYPGPMHILELGASAGLNQNWDKFSYRTESWSRRGSSQVKIDTDWRGPAPAHLQNILDVSSRAACDQNPVDVYDAAAARRLKSYAWPDQPERLTRLDAAISLAVASGTRVEKADAADWLKVKLEARPQTGLTVVYHSVFLQYPPANVRTRIVDLITSAGESANPDRPLAWLSMEPRYLFYRPNLDNVNPNLMITQLRMWPEGGDHTFLTTDGHVTRVQTL